MTNQQAKAKLAFAVVFIITLTVIVSNFGEITTFWKIATVYLIVCVPVLLLICRGIDTDASELNEINSK